MDAEGISRQARAAVNALTAQLHALENQQAALLQSLQTTTSALSSLPNYNAIAPTLEQIPTYEAKLARLKSAMNQQALEVATLKRRAEEAKQKKQRNAERIKKLREKERELDRTFLKAKMAASSRQMMPTARAGPGGTGAGTPAQTLQVAVSDPSATSPEAIEILGANKVISNSPQPDIAVPPAKQVENGNTTETIKTVKRKKKARHVEMD